MLADISEGALRVCKQNVRRTGLNARVTCLLADATQPPVPALWDFDVIVCNPPYIPTADLETLDVSVRDYEPRMALDGGKAWTFTGPSRRAGAVCCVPGGPCCLRWAPDRSAMWK